MASPFFWRAESQTGLEACVAIVPVLTLLDEQVSRVEITSQTWSLPSLEKTGREQVMAIVTIVMGAQDFLSRMRQG